MNRVFKKSINQKAPQELGNRATVTLVNPRAFRLLRGFKKGGK
jgi:hypothetical protein|tara:strand:+ start:163 stop:291 length:129 start_codon:yes stop_codon:yes gene_type:complete